MTVRSALIALSAMALLGGCAALEKVPDESMAMDAIESPDVPSSVLAPATASGAKKTDGKARRQVAKNPPIPPTRPDRQEQVQTVPALEELPVIEPGQLVGLSMSGVMKLLGVPHNTAQRPPSTVWSYRSEGCALELYLYLDVATGLFRVVTFELSGKDGEAAQQVDASCLERLRMASREY